MSWSGFIIGNVYDDTSGQPLPEAIIEILDLTTKDIFITTNSDESGKYLLNSDRAPVLLRIGKTGYTHVERTIVNPEGPFFDVLDVRLTPLGDTQSVSSLNGVFVAAPIVNSRARGAQALNADLDINMTSISLQGPQNCFPLGWSPLDIIDIQADQQAMTQGVNVTLTDRTGLASGMSAVIAKYDTGVSSWVALSEVTIPDDGQILFSDAGQSMQLALLLPDSGDGAPISPVVGQPLSEGSEIPIPENATAIGTVAPMIGRVDDPTPAEATITISTDIMLRSGTPIRGEFMEVFLLSDGKQFSPLISDRDFFAYRLPSASGGLSLQTQFPIAPSKKFWIKRGDGRKDNGVAL